MKATALGVIAFCGAFFYAAQGGLFSTSYEYNIYFRASNFLFFRLFVNGKLSCFCFEVEYSWERFFLVNNDCKTTRGLCKAVVSTNFPLH